MSEDDELRLEVAGPHKNRGPFLVTGCVGILCIAVVLKWIVFLLRSNEVRLSYFESQFDSYSYALVSIVGSFLVLSVALRADYFLNERLFRWGWVSPTIIAPIRWLIYLFGAITTLLVLAIGIFLVLAIFFVRGCRPQAPPYESGLYIRLEGPESVRANESFTLKANLEVKLVEENSKKRLELIRPHDRPDDHGVLPDKPTELYASMRLQPGTFVISNSAGNWEKQQLQILRVEYDSKDSTRPASELRRPQLVQAEGNWVWVLVPQLDRYGKQQMVVEAIAYDSQGNPISFLKRMTQTIQVENPLGIPSWLIYFLSIVGGVLTLPFVTWVYQEVSLRLREKREVGRSARKALRIGRMNRRSRRK